jgi:hypothetical protein
MPQPNEDRCLGSLAQIPVLLCIYFFTAILPLMHSKRLLIGFSHFSSKCNLIRVTVDTASSVQKRPSLLKNAWKRFKSGQPEGVTGHRQRDHLVSIMP